MRSGHGLVLAILAAPIAAQVAHPQDAAAEKVLAELAPRWTAAMHDLGVPGMAVVVVRGDRVVFRRTFGTRDGMRPVTEHTAFYIASATKPFVALAVMQLVEAGKVELDAPVRRYLPRFRVADDEVTERLTVRELLSHAPGISSGPIVMLDAYTGDISEDRYYRFLAEVQPSGKVTYSNVHYTLAGRLIEAVTGQGWRDYLAEHVFGPAGMVDATGYADAMYAREDVALPMLPAAGRPVPCQRKTDRTMHAAGGLGTSIRDLERWLIVQLDGGKVGDARLLSEDGMTELLDLQSELDEPDGQVRRMTGFALGWQYGTFRGRPYRQHGGGYTGAAAHISFLPEDRLGVACVANTSGGGQALLQVVSIDVYDRLLGIGGDDFLPGFAAQAKRYAEHLAAARPRTANPAVGDGLSGPAPAYVGAYTNEDWGEVRIELVDDVLSASIGDLRAELFSAGRDAFLTFVAPDTTNPGHFELGTDGAPQAVILDMGDGHASVRFVRRGK